MKTQWWWTTHKRSQDCWRLNAIGAAYTSLDVRAFPPFCFAALTSYLVNALPVINGSLYLLFYSFDSCTAPFEESRRRRSHWRGRGFWRRNTVECTDSSWSKARQWWVKKESSRSTYVTGSIFIIWSRMGSSVRWRPSRLLSRWWHDFLPNLSSGSNQSCSCWNLISCWWLWDCFTNGNPLQTRKCWEILRVGRSHGHVVRSVGAEQLEKLMPKSREKLVGWHHALKRKIS
jgi:hypothetical protein